VLVEAAPADYRATVDPGRAVADLGLVDRVHGGTTDLATAIDLDEDDRSVWRLRVARRDQRAPLSTLLPLLTHLGLTALDQHPYRFDLPEHVVHLDDIGVALPEGVDLDPGAADELLATFEALERGEVESDGWNRLVLVAGTTARQAAVVRSYARYLRQIGFPFSQTYLEDTLLRHPRIARLMIDLFEARFEPEVTDRDAIVAEVGAALDEALDDVQSLDDDRICRAFVGLIRATTRTNVFRHRPVMAFKFDPSLIPDLPRPKPMFEIFVCSPRVEGVHLRGGRIARGGLRWSDRREDFRTEVLGLVKAQMVKNAVIVPAGAKGGFVLKRPPADPGELRTEAVACYREFVGGLLDLTDNVVDGRVVHPERTVVHDGEDPYLVVAADKGTASFSDIANAVAAEYGFWLGDAFASGGSAGYDHKEMGITARGAWESVRRHARVLGIDADRDPITVVGIGDMSGDVFGNGLLRSPHVRLVAAFDHRHVFLDPDPDPAVAFEERRRLFELPRSSWADYDPSKISGGGGVYSRAAKSVPLSPAVRRVLGVSDEHLSPPELIRAVLTAPVDLLWNGGIGTYVKASTETHAEVGDRSNDGVRVDAADLRCRMIGEGGNLGLTQRARVEYALAGGLVYSDAIDNSAGVDCSDHEVNIKILLGDAIAAGALPVEERDALLEAMTDEVAELVLDDNQAQTLALVIARHQSFAMVDVHARYLDLLEAEGWLDRTLEDLPSPKEIAERQARGSGLRAPEFAVMIAYTKNADVTELLESDVPDDPALEADLAAYFPQPLQERFPEQIRGHRLRREIVTTRLVNQMVNLSGISFDHRMTEETGASVADVARAWVAVREILAFDRHWESIDDLGTSVPLATQLDLFMDVRRMAERCVLWLLRNRRPPLDIAVTAEEFTVPVRWLGDHLRPVLLGDMEVAVSALEQERLDAGVPEAIARASGVWRLLHTGFDLVEISRSADVPLAGTATAYWHLFDRLDLMWLWEGIGALPRATRWQNQARSALRDDLLSVLAALAATVVTAGGNSVDRSIDAWSAVNERTIGRVAAILTEIRRTEARDLTSLSVALRQLRNLVQTSVTSR
jgi:glutamate dehydrogenase